MDADGLPIVGPGIDYTKVGAIHQKRTLAFLNHFITHTVRFLNRFSCVCEEKLENMTVRLQRLETTMNILEAKLLSIPGLENVTAPSASETDSAAPTSQSLTPGGTTTAVSPHPKTEDDEAGEQDEVAGKVAAPLVVEEKPIITVSQDPRYTKYFKMLQVGVPAAALSQKMIQDGLDPALLNDPNAQAPAGGDMKKDEESEPEFSDEEPEKSHSEEDDSSSGFSD